MGEPADSTPIRPFAWEEPLRRLAVVIARLGLAFLFFSILHTPPGVFARGLSTFENEFILISFLLKRREGNTLPVKSIGFPLFLLPGFGLPVSF